MKAIFPGSFDPFTLGHLDVLVSSLNIFDEVVIAIGHNHQKKGLFEIEKRMEIIRLSTIEYKDRINIISYDGLTTSICEELEIFNIIRGVRTIADFEMETIFAQANKKLNSSIQTIFIPTSPEYSFISSTIVRDVLLNNGDITHFISQNAIKLITE